MEKVKCPKCGFEVKQAKSKYILDDFAEALKDIAVIDKPSKVEGRSMVMFLTVKR